MENRSGHEGAGVRVVPSGRRDLLLPVLLFALLLAGCGRAPRLHTNAGPGSLALDARGRTLYVACEGSRTVQAWDLERRKLLAERPAGAGPLRLYLNRSQSLLYVLARGERRVRMFSLPDLKPKRTLTLSDAPAAWAWEAERGIDLFCGPDNDLVRPYLAGNALPTLEAGRDPVDLWLQPNTDRLWVANDRGSELVVVSLEEGRVTHRVPVRSNPRRLAGAPLGDQLFVLCAGTDDMPPDGVVQSVDLNYFAGGLGQTVGPGARDLVFGPLGRALYCVMPDGLLVLPLGVGERRAFRTGRDPQAVAVSPDESRAYVSCRQDRSVTLLRLDR
jgi:DNA-binding beta-propeller fold protein YncE